jgi:DNA invertase Pin-like site-specific DNA recombinase
MTPPGTRAAAYARISDDRIGDAAGVQRQMADCEVLIAARGWTLVERFTDNDISAYSGKKRPGFEAVLEALHAGTIDAVVCWHPDRLTRSPRDLERLLDTIEATGGVIASVTAGDVDLGTPSGRAVARTLTAWARHESEHKAERVRRKIASLVAEGKPHNGGRRPFGYTRDKMRLVEEEASVFAEVAERALTGESLRAVMRDLNDRGVPTTTGGRWSLQGLRLMLLNPRYAGRIVYHRADGGPASWPAVISLETHHALVTLLTDPSRTTRGPRARKHPLTGLVFCDRCGTKMSAARVTGTMRYVCRADDGGCGGRVIRLEPLEELVRDLVLLKTQEVVSLEPDEPDPAADLRRALQRDEARLEALAQAFAADDDGDALDFRRAARLLRDKVAAARQELSLLEGRAMAGLPDNETVRATWWDLDFGQRQRLFQSFIAEVRIGPGRRGVNRFDHERVTVVWR